MECGWASPWEMSTASLHFLSDQNLIKFWENFFSNLSHLIYSIHLSIQGKTGVLCGLSRSVSVDDHLAWLASQPCCPSWTGWFVRYESWQLAWLEMENGCTLVDNQLCVQSQWTYLAFLAEYSLFAAFVEEVSEERSWSGSCDGRLSSPQVEVVAWLKIGVIWNKSCWNNVELQEIDDFKILTTWMAQCLVEIELWSHNPDRDSAFWSHFNFRSNKSMLELDCFQMLKTWMSPAGVMWI